VGVETAGYDRRVGGDLLEGWEGGGEGGGERGRIQETDIQMECASSAGCECHSKSEKWLVGWAVFALFERKEREEGLLLCTCMYFL
jgi:hypothetical protein